VCVSVLYDCYSFTHSLIHSFIYSLTLAVSQSLTHSLIYSFTHSLIHSPTHSFIHSLTHSLTHTHTHYHNPSGEHEAQNPFITALTDSTDVWLPPARDLLTPAAFHFFTRLLLKQICRSLEREILPDSVWRRVDDSQKKNETSSTATVSVRTPSKRFSLLGAMRFDSEVRALSKLFSTHLEASAREVTARLRQVCVLLCVESVEEAVELWRDASLVRLGDPVVVKSLMCARREFDRVAVVALDLM